MTQAVRTRWLCCEGGECPLDPGTYIVWIVHPNSDGVFCRVKISVPAQDDPADECRTPEEIQQDEGVRPDHCWNVDFDWRDADCVTKPPEDGVFTGQDVCTVEITDVPDDCDEVSEGEEIHLPCPDGTCPIDGPETVLAGSKNRRCEVTVEKIEECHFESSPGEIWRHDEDWGGENLVFSGSLRESLDKLSQSVGIPLDGNPGPSSLHTCHPEEERHCIGFRWELPPDRGNATQSDSVRFDIGFYTEQCRNNQATEVANSS